MTYNVFGGTLSLQSVSQYAPVTVTVTVAFVVRLLQLACWRDTPHWEFVDYVPDPASISSVRMWDAEMNKNDAWMLLSTSSWVSVLSVADSTHGVQRATENAQSPNSRSVRDTKRLPLVEARNDDRDCMSATAVSSSIVRQIEIVSLKLSLQSHALRDSNCISILAPDLQRTPQHELTLDPCSLTISAWFYGLSWTPKTTAPGAVATHSISPSIRHWDCLRQSLTLVSTPTVATYNFLSILFFGVDPVVFRPSRPLRYSAPNKRRKSVFVWKIPTLHLDEW